VNLKSLFSKTLFALFLVSQVWAIGPIISYVQLSTGATQSGGFNTSTGTVTTSLSLPYVTGVQCLESVNGGIQGTGGVCGAGGGGSGASGTITVSPKNQIAAYSQTGSSNVVSGIAGFNATSSSVAISIPVTISSENVTGQLTAGTLVLPPGPTLQSNTLFTPSDILGIPALYTYGQFDVFTTSSPGMGPTNSPGPAFVFNDLGPAVFSVNYVDGSGVSPQLELQSVNGKNTFIQGSPYTSSSNPVYTLPSNTPSATFPLVMSSTGQINATGVITVSSITTSNLQQFDVPFASTTAGLLAGTTNLSYVPGGAFTANTFVTNPVGYGGDGMVSITGYAPEYLSYSLFGTGGYQVYSSTYNDTTSQGGLLVAPSNTTLFNERGGDALVQMGDPADIPGAFRVMGGVDGLMHTALVVDPLQQSGLFLDNSCVEFGCTTNEKPQANAELELRSTDKGFLPPRWTTTQRFAISISTPGIMGYDTTLNALYVSTASNRTSWVAISSASGGGGGGGITALTGAVTASGVGSVVATAAAVQGDMRTFSSSITVSGSGGLGVTYGATVGSMTVNGAGNGNIILTVSGSTYSVTASSGPSVTAGHCVDWTGSYTLGDTGAACGSGSGGTPGGSTGQLQYDNAGSFGGAKSFVTSSSMTITSSMSVTTNGAQNSTPGVLDVYGGAAYSGQPLLMVGSANQSGQLSVKDQTAVGMTSYGSQSGHLEVGQLNNTINQKITTDQTNNQFINFWNSGEMDIQTDLTSSGGKNIVFLPLTVNEVTISTSGVTLSPFTNATLPNAANGTIAYCSDCTVTTSATCVGVISAACVCAGSGNGAFAKRLNGTWYCN
jgi:hypothetical protein